MGMVIQTKGGTYEHKEIVRKIETNLIESMEKNEVIEKQ